MVKALGCGWRSEDSNPTLDTCVNDIMMMTYYKFIEPKFFIIFTMELHV
jgi:hypothetical protein